MADALPPEQATLAMKPTFIERHGAGLDQHKNKRQRDHIKAFETAHHKR